MHTDPRLPPQDLVDIATCKVEIPLSEACCEEAIDYVMFYCGLECYYEWSHAAPVEPVAEPRRR